MLVTQSGNKFPFKTFCLTFAHFEKILFIFPSKLKKNEHDQNPTKSFVHIDKVLYMERKKPQSS